MNFHLKLKLFKFFQKILSFFNLKIYYSKEPDYFNSLDVKNIIDVGVEKGTRFLNSKFPLAFYYLVEANPKYYEYLENIFLKKFNGKLFKFAAGKEEGNQLLYDAGPISSFYKRENFNFKKKINVKILPLDIILLKENITRDTILKIDCEGGELEVLKGASKTLEQIEYVIIELRLQKITTYNPSEVINFLYEKKFIWKQILNVYFAKVGIDYIDILFQKKP